MPRKTMRQEANELAIEYRKRGIQYCYNDRNHNVYLSLLNAPHCDPTTEGCKLTGYFVLDGGVRESRNIADCITRLIVSYRRAYHGNATMLAFLNTIDING